MAFTPAYPAHVCRGRPPAMMYFSRLKTATILAVCVLGVLLCLPNLLAAPAGWLPWRQVRLGLDLRGGSYLLLEVDMARGAARSGWTAWPTARATRCAARSGLPAARRAAGAEPRRRSACPRDPQQDDGAQLLRERRASARRQRRRTTT